MKTGFVMGLIYFVTFLVVGLALIALSNAEELSEDRNSITLEGRGGVTWHDVDAKAEQCLKDLNKAFTSVCTVVGDGKSFDISPNPCDEELSPIRVICSVDVKATTFVISPQL
jgi:hypothetical protein